MSKETRTHRRTSSDMPDSSAEEGSVRWGASSSELVPLKRQLVPLLMRCFKGSQSLMYNHGQLVIYVCTHYQRLWVNVNTLTCTVHTLKV